jgi:hypothetical protein
VMSTTSWAVPSNNVSSLHDGDYNNWPALHHFHDSRNLHFTSTKLYHVLLSNHTHHRMSFEKHTASWNITLEQITTKCPPDALQRSRFKSQHLCCPWHTTRWSTWISRELLIYFHFNEFFFWSNSFFHSFLLSKLIFVSHFPVAVRFSSFMRVSYFYHQAWRMETRGFVMQVDHWTIRLTHTQRRLDEAASSSESTSCIGRDIWVLANWN